LRILYRVAAQGVEAIEFCAMIRKSAVADGTKTILSLHLLFFQLASLSGRAALVKLKALRDVALHGEQNLFVASAGFVKIES